MSEPRLTSTDVVYALILDRSPDSGWMRQWGRDIIPRNELWLAGAQLWVRADGSYASGWRGKDHVAAHFGWLARLRIRQAVRWWAKRQPTRGTSDARVEVPGMPDENSLGPLV